MLGKLLLSLPKVNFLFAFFFPFFFIFVFHVLLFLIDFFCGRSTNMKCVHGIFSLEKFVCFAVMPLACLVSSSLSSVVSLKSIDLLWICDGGACREWGAGLVFFLDKTNQVESQSSFRKNNVQGRWNSLKVTFNTLLSEQGLLYVFFHWYLWDKMYIQYCWRTFLENHSFLLIDKYFLY